ncbi:MAG TPA: helix-turn-helix domain-containing protein [Terriglobales bacterium]|nr:helix-turn-helix domain-containing protein [Terriglobales bacterium]
MMRLVWERAPYKGATLLLLLRLADRADDEGICWPSVESLARDTRLGIRHAHNILAELKADGVFSVEAGGGRGRFNRYKLHLETLNSGSLKQASLNLLSMKSATETLQSNSENPEIFDNAIRKNHQESSKESPIKNARKFVPPTLEEVSAYCEERHNGISALTFISHYESVGWMRGKNRITNWKAAVRYWEGNGVYTNGQQSRAEQRHERQLAEIWGD